MDYKEFLPKSKNYIIAIREFIEYYNEEDGLFIDHGGDLTIKEKFEYCMEKLESNCIDTFNKKWRFYFKSEDGFITNYHIIWLENEELQEFSFQDSGHY